MLRLNFLYKELTELYKELTKANIAILSDPVANSLTNPAIFAGSISGDYPIPDQ